jgi:hypothetical protein
MILFSLLAYGVYALVTILTDIAYSHGSVINLFITRVLLSSSKKKTNIFDCTIQMNPAFVYNKSKIIQQFSAAAEGIASVPQLVDNPKITVAESLALRGSPSANYCGKGRGSDQALTGGGAFIPDNDTNNVQALVYRQRKKSREGSWHDPLMVIVSRHTSNPV